MSLIPDRALITDYGTNKMCNLNKFKLDVHTYVLFLELSNIDFERNTYSVWVELGFYYNAYDYFRIFDKFTDSEDLKEHNEVKGKVFPKGMSIPFDIVNAVSKDLRSESHFIRECNGKPLFFWHDENANKATDPNNAEPEYLSEKKNLKDFVTIEDCERDKNKYWKHETRTFSMELTFTSKQEFAPFDEMFFFFKLITDNCKPGTEYIKFRYNKIDSDFIGMDCNKLGIYPSIPFQNDGIQDDGNQDKDVIDSNPHIFENHTYYGDDTSVVWDRMYICFFYKKNKMERVLTYYIMPYLLFYYMVIQNLGDSMLGTSSSLVLANVALLIVSQNKIFAFYEMAVVIQILILIIATLIMAATENQEDAEVPLEIRLYLGIANGVIALALPSAQYCYAHYQNEKICGYLKEGDYKKLGVV